MHEVLKRIGEIGLLPVVKLDRAEDALPLGRALLAGGIGAAEITFRTSAAAEAIALLSRELPELLTGAGTVLSVEQARAAEKAGARFAVSPGFNPSVVDECLSLGLPMLPGVNGPEGVERGLEKGLEVLKFFPAEASGGLAMLDSLAGPYQNLRFVPTGGIGAANLGDYARRPQVLAVGGSWMVKPELIAAGDWKAIERLSREAVAALHGFGFAHLGINGSSEAEGRAGAELAASLFGLPIKEGSSSFMLGTGLEITKSPFPGAKGHIAIRCNDVERAVAYFAARGLGTIPESGRREKGRLKAVYLQTELLGFAIHLLKA